MEKSLNSARRLIKTNIKFMKMGWTCQNNLLHHEWSTWTASTLQAGVLDNQVTLRWDQINCCSSQLIHCNFQLVRFRPNLTIKKINQYSSKLKPKWRVSMYQFLRLQSCHGNMITCSTTDGYVIQLSINVMRIRSAGRQNNLPTPTNFWHW